MTMIACTLNYKVPFMVGDILVSNDEIDKSIQLPTNTINIDQYLPEDKKSKASGLFQKIYVVRDNICIALAGIVYEMKLFLDDFRKLCIRYDKIEDQQVIDLFKEYEQAGHVKFACFIMIVDQEGEDSINVRLFRYPKNVWEYTISDAFEGAYACGTGSQDYLSQIKDGYSFDASAEKGDIFHALSLNFSFIAKLLATERVSFNTIKKDWGAGFETIFYNGKSFVKLEDVAYVICEGQFDESGEIDLPVPTLILHYRYHNEVLFISSIELHKSQRKDEDDIITIVSKNYSADLFVVPPIDWDKTVPIELPYDYSFKTNRIAIGYAIISKANGIFAPAFFSESKDLSVHYRDEVSIEIKLHHGVNDKIRAGAKSAFPNLDVTS